MMLFRRPFVGRDEPSECPDVSRLRDLLDEAVPARELVTLTAHLDACTVCQQRLEELAGGPCTTVANPDRLGPSLARVMNELREVSPTDLTTEPAEADNEEPALGFLQPSTEPGHLGRFGPYEILEVLGRGGMGIVLKAFDAVLHRIVAIKVLAPQLAVSGAARKRFAREARAAAAVCHEHVVPIYNVDTVHGLPYLVMQYVPGLSLQERLDRDGSLQLEEVLRIGMQTASGLAAAHAQGLIHRDIKPANLLLENGVERVRLTDFSLARAVDDASVTRSGFLAGTPAYMAPEQARGDTIDHRADLFSLGSVIYAMCTGRTPFRAGTTLALLRRVSEETPPPMQDINPNMPEWMDKLMTRLHAKAPAQRFQSAQEVADTLGSCLAHVQNPRVNPLPSWLMPRPKQPRRQGLEVALFAACFVVAILLAMGVVTRVNTPQGTLIIEVNDPEVQVTVEGQEVTLNGKNIGEVKLKPGTYKVEANKEGKPIKTQLVQIERGGKVLVTVTLEPAPNLPVKPVDQRNVVVEPWALATHDSKITALMFSPDSRHLITGSADGKVQLYTTRNGKLINEITDHKTRIVTATFLDKPELYLTLSSDGMMKLWELGTAKPLTSLKIAANLERADIVGRTGQVLGMVNKNVRIWEMDTGKVVGEIKYDKPVVDWKVSGDGKRLAICQDGEIEYFLFEPTSLRPLWKATIDKKQEFTNLAFSPDGELLFSTTTDNDTIVWDSASGRKVNTLFLGQNPAVSTDGKWLATVQTQEKLLLWDVATGKSLRTYMLPDAGKVTKLAFSPDRKWIAWGTTDGKVFLLSLEKADIGTGVKPTPVDPRDPRRAQQEQLYLDQMNKALEAWMKQQDIKESGRLLDDVDRDFRGLEWSILKSLGHRGRNPQPFNSVKDPVRSLALSPDGKLAVLATGDFALMCEVTTGKELRRIRADKAESFVATAISPDAKRIATLSSDNTLAFWDTATGNRTLSQEISLSGAATLSFSPDGKRLALCGYRDGKQFYGLYSAETGKRLQTINEDAPVQAKGYVGVLAFSPDGNLVATAGDEKHLVRLTNVGTTEVLSTMEGHEDRVRAIAFSPDGKLLVTASDDKTVKVWTVPTGKLVMSLKHRTNPHAVCFSREVNRIVTGTEDGEIHFWDTASGKKVLILPAHTATVNVLAISPDGKILFSGGKDGNVHAWGR